MTQAFQTIEVCTGVGMNQLFPQTITINIPANPFLKQYNKYRKFAGKLEEPDYEYHVDDPNANCTRLMTEQEFSYRMVVDETFASKW
jgi:hypothetical protein